MFVHVCIFKVTLCKLFKDGLQKESKGISSLLLNVFLRILILKMWVKRILLVNKGEATLYARELANPKISILL